MEESEIKLAYPVPYFQVSNEVFNAVLSHVEFRVYCYICRCWNNDKRAFPSYNTIAKQCQMDRRTAVKSIKALEKKGMLKAQRKRKANRESYVNRYEIVLPIPCARGSGQKPPRSGDVPPGSGSTPPNKELSYEEPNYKEEHETNAENDICLAPDNYLIHHYLKAYKEHTGRPHPRLRKEQWARVESTLVAFAQEHGIEEWTEMTDMVDEHFEGSGLKTDYNINHFATQGVLFWLHSKYAGPGDRETAIVHGAKY